MKKAIAILGLLCSPLAFADVAPWDELIRGSPAATLATDFNCLNDCTRRGYMYNYCNAQCSTEPVKGPSQTDFKCLNDCTRQGYLYSLCQARCSY